MMKIILLAAIASFSNFISQAQDLKSFGVGQPWHVGRITLVDGIELKGLVRNNDKEGIISFKEHEKDPTTHSFRPFDILSLEYNDQGVKRKFYSLETKDKDEVRADIYLYEVIREYNDFAILSFQGIVDIVESKTTNSSFVPGAFGQPTASNNSRTVFQQVEEIYFLGDGGERELYLILVKKDIDGLFDYSSNKGKVLDSSLPIKYFGEEKWNKIKTHLKNQNLKIKTRENLINMLNYYETLVNP